MVSAVGQEALNRIYIRQLHAGCVLEACSRKNLRAPVNVKSPWNAAIRLNSGLKRKVTRVVECTDSSIRDLVRKSGVEWRSLSKQLTAIDY